MSVLARLTCFCLLLPKFVVLLTSFIVIAHDHPLGQFSVINVFIMPSVLSKGLTLHLQPLSASPLFMCVYERESP